MEENLFYQLVIVFRNFLPTRIWGYIFYWLLGFILELSNLSRNELALLKEPIFQFDCHKGLALKQNIAESFVREQASCDNGY